MMISYDGEPETRAFWGKNLPHWDVYARPIFVTLHVRGAIPDSAVKRIHADATNLMNMRGSDYSRKQKLIFKRLEEWLDRSDHQEWLTDPKVACMLRNAIEVRSNGQKWTPLHWVIMPSHLHILYIGGNASMKNLMRDFKRWTATQANKMLGRSGERFWQDEWFDHWSRSAGETERIGHYIRQNPVKAGLVEKAEDWPYASWAQKL
jgi:REP element-mobilizing transposase RayT